MSFDFSSLFTMVALDYTNDLTLTVIYDDKKLKPRLERRILKFCYYYAPRTFISLLEFELTTKKMVLPWDPLLVQCQIPMGSPLDPL